MGKIKNYTFLIIVLIILGSFSYKIIRRALADYMLKYNPVYTKAVIINEKNYEPNQSVKPEFTYSYMFTIAGKVYINNSHNIKAKVGDTVVIAYVKGLPSLNKPLHPSD